MASHEVFRNDGTVQNSPEVMNDFWADLGIFTELHFCANLHKH